eukprot:TRINITY_DN25333_c0_g2_i1.p1 TRINITY_DN25333_c0_g2~~TRINITY_DN25333_c0_g2_i1.p1  ORF type:complete len:799 (-),score=109.37 TRINITY_DN25333_c0_g2_i1:213-2570(-)
MAFSEGLRVSFPKYVTIGNSRIAFCYFFLLAGVIFSRLITGGISRTWTITVPLISHAAVRLNTKESERRIASRDYWAHSLCRDKAKVRQSTNSFLDGFEWRGSKCADHCTQLNYDVWTAGACRELVDVVTSDGTGLTLRYISKWYNVFAKQDNVSKLTQTGVWTVINPFIEDVVLDISYEHYSDQVVAFSVDIELGEKKTATSVLLDKDGKIYKIYINSQHISLPISEIFGSLTHLSMEKGAQLFAVASCYNDDFDVSRRLPLAEMFKLTEKLIIASSAIPTCIVSLDAGVDELRQSLEGFTDKGNQLEYIEHDSITIEARAGSGTKRVMELTASFNFLTSMLVLMIVPKMLLTFVLKRCLGTLSKVYKKALFEPFSVTKRSVGAAITFMSQGAIFDTLVDSHDDYTISREALVHRLTQVFHSNARHYLPTSEIKVFSEWVIQRLHTLAGKDKTAGDNVTLEEFCTAVSHAEPLDFHTVTRLFNPKRKAGFLERLFTPASLRKMLKFEANADELASFSNLRDLVQTGLGHSGDDLEDQVREETSLHVKTLGKEVKRLQLEVEQLKLTLAEMTGQPRGEGLEAVNAKVTGVTPKASLDQAALQEAVLFILELEASKHATFSYGDRRQPRFPLSNKLKEALEMLGAESLITALEVSTASLEQRLHTLDGRGKQKQQTLDGRGQKAEIGMTFGLASSLCERLDGLEAQQSAQRLLLQSIDGQQASVSHSIMQLAVLVNECVQNANSNNTLVTVLAQQWDRSLQPTPPSTNQSVRRALVGHGNSNSYSI